MTKGEIRKARKEARREGRPLTGELSLPSETSVTDPSEFSETSKGYIARERWAKGYDELNGAPEGEWDR